MHEIIDIYKAFLQSTGISTDSRNCPAGSMFVALKGERFDGNQYVKAVLEEGAAYVISDCADFINEDHVFVVKDALSTLQDLARYHRRQLGIPIVAITGTNGKTTTKELLAAVLSSQFNVKATVGNFNNHIGVPLTLLSFDASMDIGVVEMGANHIGEIKALCEIAEPNYGMITNVGKAHLEGFGSFDGVKTAKGEMYDYLQKSSGCIFINKENAHLQAMAQLNEQRFEYGQGGDVDGEIEQLAPFLSVKWGKKNQFNSYHVQTNLIGGYNLENILSAIAIGVYFKVDEKNINSALESYQPTNNRSQFVETKSNKVIMDAYNANPSSMEVAISNFSMVEAEYKTIILGGMKEMGEDSDAEHEKLVKLIGQHDFANIILVGDEFKAYDKIKTNVHWFSNQEQLSSYLSENPIVKNYILVKGSRSNQLEKILTVL